MANGQFWRELRKQLKGMTSRSRIYREIKAEVEGRGHWRAKGRGNARKGGLVSKARREGIEVVVGDIEYDGID